MTRKEFENYKERLALLNNQASMDAAKAQQSFEDVHKFRERYYEVLREYAESVGIPVLELSMSAWPKVEQVKEEG